MINNYYCYNPVKKDFICNMGQVYIDTGKHYTTNKEFWIFERGDKLDNILKKWRIFQNMRFEQN